MMKYSEITLTDEEKKILEWLKSQDYTHIGRYSNNGFLDALDKQKGIQVNLKPMRKPFEFIEKNEWYEIEKLLNPPQDPKTVWDLEEGDVYWWMSSAGFVCKSKWESSRGDIHCRNQGNVFLTKEEAEFEKKRREVVTKVKKYARPFNDSRENWAPSCGGKTIDMSFVYAAQEAHLYFESKEKIEQAVAEVGEEDFKKYYLGVTE